MAIHPDIPPPPTSDEYLRAAKGLDTQFHRDRSILLAVAREVARLPIHQARQYMSHSRSWGMAIEAGEQLSDADRRITTMEAFIFGSATGLALTARAHGGIATGTNMVSAFDNLQFAPLADNYGQHVRQVARELVEISDLGVMAMGSRTGDIVRRWERRCVSGEEKQAMFRRGVGMAAFLACRVHKQLFDTQEQPKLERQAKQADAGVIDWDAALRGLDDAV